MKNRMNELIQITIVFAMVVGAMVAIDRRTGMFSIPFRVLLGGIKGVLGIFGVFYPIFRFVFRLLFNSKKKEGASFLNKRESHKLFGKNRGGVLIDGHKRRLSAKDAFAGIAVISPSGSGKTTVFVLPNVFTLAKEGHSMIITDISGEIYQSTSGYLGKQGYDIQVLNLGNLDQGLKYNPLANIQSYSDAAGLAHVLIKSANPKGYEKDPMWFNGAENILTVLITTLQAINDPELLHLPNVLRLLQQMGQGQGKIFEDFLAKHAPESAWNLFFQLKEGNEKMFQSYYSIAANSLGFLNDPQLAQIFTRNELYFSALRQRKTALFLTLPANKLSQYSVIINIAYTQLFTFLMSKYPLSSQDKSVYVIGDEWGHTAVPNFSVICTNIRKYQVSISIILQSENQLSSHYSISDAKTILEGGMASKLFYSGLDTETAKRVEAMLGKEISFQGRHNDIYREKNLLNADGIRTLGNNEAIFITTNKKPALFTDTKYCFKHPKFKRFMKMTPVPQPQILPERIRFITLGQDGF